MAARKLGTRVRREQIAQAALSLVASRGVKALSIAAVARKVGIVPAGIYRHFASKREMLDAVLDLLRRKLLDNVDAVRKQTPNSLERLRRLISRHIGAINLFIVIPRVFLSEDAYESPGVARTKAHDLIASYLEAVAGIVREGQDHGVIRRDINSATVAIMFIGVAQPPAMFRYLARGRFDVERHVEEAWRVFSEAIRAGKRAPHG